MAQRTTLYTAQQQRGGKFIDFNGWDMPVQFTSITAEHQIVRTNCGVFDLGHMGRLRLRGPSALALLEKEVCRPLKNMRVGQVRYGLVLADDGTVEDDVLVSREEDDAFHIVVNAGNLAKIRARWQTLAGSALADLSAHQAMLAVQGPTACKLLQGLGLDGSHLPYYYFADCTWNGHAVRLSRTGYTGEDGFECFIANEHAVALYEAVVAAGAAPCGLGCRDTLRLEAGMPLYGNELDRTVTPVEAGLSFALNKNGGFNGAEVVLKQMRDGSAKKLVGLKMRDKRVPRHGYPVMVNGQNVGVVTSGTLSPTLGYALGMAYVPTTSSAVGSIVEVDIRGTMCTAEVVALPFYRRG
jgi:aminomethyltransferase